IIAKYRDYAGTALGATRAQAIEDAVRRLEEPKAPFAPLIELTCQASAGARRPSLSTPRLSTSRLATPRPRDHIPGLEPYKLTERDASGRRLIRLDQNEKAADPSPAAMAAAEAALIETNRYPEGDAASLRAAIAETEGLPADQI